MGAQDPTGSRALSPSPSRAMNTQHPSARAPSRARAPLPDPRHAAAQSSSAALEPPARPPPAALLAVDEDVTKSDPLAKMLNIE